MTDKTKTGVSDGLNESILLRDLAEDLHTNPFILSRMFRDAGIVPEQPTAAVTTHLVTYLQIEQVGKVYEPFGKVLIAGPDTEAVRNFCERNNMTVETLNSLCAGIGMTLQRYLYRNGRGPRITKAQIAELEEKYRAFMELPIAPSDVMKIERFATAEQTDVPTVLYLCDEADIELAGYRFKRTVGLGISKDQRTKWHKTYDVFRPDVYPVKVRPANMPPPEIAPADVRSVETYARGNHTSRVTVLKKCSEANIVPDTYKFGSKPGLGLTDAQIIQLESLGH